MDNYDFRNIINFMFKDREKYEKVSDEEKTKNFFIINRKFARAYPIHAEFFNKKNIDKPSALDIWYSFCHKKRFNNIPQWYWGKKAASKSKPISTIIKKEEIKYFIDFYDIEEDDIHYLIENHLTDFKLEIKKYRKFNKK